jgi:hypothetical protein
LTRRHEGAKTQRFLFRAKLAKEQGRKEFEKEDAKARFFFKTKLLINGKCFQPFEPFEPIERFEPFKHFLVTKAQRHKDFCFAQSSQRSKDAKNLKRKMQRHDFFFNKVAYKWKILLTF